MRWSTSRPWDLVLALVLLLLLDALVALGVGGPARVALGLVAVLVVPGYLLAAALFPARHRVVEVRAGEAGEEETRRSEEGLDGLERAALSVGLSVAVVPLLGLALNFSPWGVRLAPVLAALTLFSLACAGAAAWRRARLPPDARFRVQIDWRPAPWSSYAPVDKALAVALGAAVLVALAALAYVASTPRQAETFTEFYVLGPGGRASDYPANLTPGQPATVRLGLVNHEGQAVTYSLRVVDEPGEAVNGTGGRAFSPRAERELAAWSVTLEPGAQWEEPFNLTLAETGTHRVRFELDKPGEPSPYRRLHLFVTVRA